MNEKIVLKNHQLTTLDKVLNYNMPFQKGRIKNSFLMIIGPKMKAINEARIEILESLADKDANGKSILKTGEDGQSSYSLSDENLAKFVQEHEKLILEDCVIDNLPSLKVNIPELKQIINNSPIELTPQETITIENILVAFDGEKKKEVVEKKTKKK